MRGLLKLAVASATMVTATMIGTAGSASALTLTVVIPNGQAVSIPAAATDGGLTAFTAVSQATDAPPIDVVVTP